MIDVNYRPFFSLLLSIKHQFTLCDDRFWISMSPFELNKKTLKARCSLMCPSSLTRWQSRLLDWPIARSNSSTRMQFSANAVSCRFFASSWFAAAMLDDQHWFVALFFKYVNDLRIKWFPSILTNTHDCLDDSYSIKFNLSGKNAVIWLLNKNQRINLIIDNIKALLTLR